jgi:long-chain acyl-CoA synthetase
MPQEITLDEGQTVARLLEAAMQAHADRPAATCLSETLLFRDIDRLSQAFANHLQTFLAKGDRVAVMLPTSLPFVVAMAGALRAGMTVVPVNPLYTPREVEHQLSDAGAVALVVADAMLLTLDPVLARTLAIVLWCLTMRAHARLVPNPRDVGTVIAEMKRSPFDMLIGVKPLFNALVGAPELGSVDFSRTRVVVGAGASVQKAVAKRWADAGGPPITEAYGLTETSPSATFNPLGRNGCIGMPVPSTDARIVDEQGRDVAIGVSGELLLRGPQVFDGYWQRPDETKKAFTDDGWFKTGDVVTMDDEGSLYLVDRKKDMILVSGFNVYPNEIEAVVAMMPEVLECACVGMPDERSGEAPQLFAVARTPDLTAAKIDAHWRANLAGYKVPRRIALVDSLPKSTVGKILRRELRQQAVQPSAE